MMKRRSEAPAEKPAKKTPAKRKPTKATNGAESVEVTRVISEEDVARRAYELWEERGRPFGSPDEDWHKAAEQLRTRP